MGWPIFVSFPLPARAYHLGRQERGPTVRRSIRQTLFETSKSVDTRHVSSDLCLAPCQKTQTVETHRSPRKTVETTRHSVVRDYAPSARHACQSPLNSSPSSSVSRCSNPQASQVFTVSNHLDPTCTKGFAISHILVLSHSPRSCFGRHTREMPLLTRLRTAASRSACPILRSAASSMRSL